MHRKNISHKLKLACCSLIGSSSGVLQAETKPWYIDLGLMNYIEQDRNTGVEFVLNAQRELDNEDVLTLNFDLDVITGATPNGASASNTPQTFTMSSGDGSYQVDANELPADDTHMDTRMAVGLMYESGYENDIHINYSSRISMEFDYLSFGGGVEFTKDINQKNTRFILGTDFEYNRVHPVGNIPIGFGRMQAAGTLQPRAGASISRRQNGLSIGVNQVLNKTSLIQFKYSYANADGYLTDPYKLLSVIDDQNTAQLGRTLYYVYEHRPDKRQIETAYAAYKTYVGNHILDLSYRYYWDDWDVTSHTLDVKFRYKLDTQYYWQPHLRIYQQSAAYFYEHSLNSSRALPEYASADLRLAEFDAYTLGIRYGKSLANGMEHSIGVEYYTQQGNSKPATAVGLQRQQDLFPDLHTLILTWNYAFYW